MKNTPAGDAEGLRIAALAIAAVYHGLACVGGGGLVRVPDAERVIEYAKRFQDYITEGK